MMGSDLLLLLPLLLPAAGGLCVSLIRLPDSARKILVTAVLALEAGGAALLLFRPDASLFLFSFSAEIPVFLSADSVSRLYLAFISLVFLLVGIYSFEYIAHEGNGSRFYPFYLLTLFALAGLSLSGSIVTFYMFYEAMTLLSLPLVTHSQTKEAVAAGIKYLLYSVVGASLALCGIFFLSRYAQSLSFAPGGVLDAAKTAGNEGVLLPVLFVMIIGFSVKAGMFPLHGWLPTAHPVAPAPASAVLSGVITKAGVLGIIRVIYYLAGAEILRGTWVQTALIILSLITVFMGSAMAFQEPVLKKRLAYSTVSQVSYVLFGLFTLSAAGLSGALLHILFHSVIKNTLFMAAGAIILKTGLTRVPELGGIGRRMPLTMACFTLVSLGLIGIPPTGGFLSKWYLAQGALAMDSAWNWVGPAVLLLSAVLTAGYLLSIVIRGFFPGEEAAREALPPSEPGWAMRIPMLILAALCLLGGMFPGAILEATQSIAAAVVH